MLNKKSINLIFNVTYLFTVTKARYGELCKSFERKVQRGACIWLVEIALNIRRVYCSVVVAIIRRLDTFRCSKAIKIRWNSALSACVGFAGTRTDAIGKIARTARESYNRENTINSRVNASSYNVDSCNATKISRVLCFRITRLLVFRCGFVFSTQSLLT